MGSATYPHLLRFITRTGLLDPALPVEHTTVSYPSTSLTTVHLGPQHMAGVLAPASQTRSLAALAELAERSTPGEPVVLCECAHWDGSPLRDLDPATAAALAWVEQLAAPARSQVARLHQLREALLETPAAAGDARVDTEVEHLRTRVAADVTRMRGEDWYLTWLARGLAHGASEWSWAAAQDPAPGHVRVLGAPPADWPTPKENADPHEVVASVGVPRAWVWACVDDVDVLAAAEEAHPGPELDYALALVAAAVVFHSASDTVVVCLDEGFTAAEVRAAEQVAAKGVPVGAVIHGLRAAG